MVKYDLFLSLKPFSEDMDVHPARYHGYYSTKLKNECFILDFCTNQVNSFFEV